jgi:hypothetical protein
MYSGDAKRPTVTATRNLRSQESIFFHCLVNHANESQFPARFRIGRIPITVPSAKINVSDPMSFSSESVSNQIDQVSDIVQKRKSKELEHGEF